MKRTLAIFTLVALVATEAFAAPFAWVLYNYDLTSTSTTYCTTVGTLGSLNELSTPTASPVCGTAATDGWVNMPGEGQATVAVVEWVTKAATSLDYSIECRAFSSSVGQVLTSGSLTAAGSYNLAILANANAFDQCRIGLKITTDSGVNSVLSFFGAKR